MIVPRPIRAGSTTLAALAAADPDGYTVDGMASTRITWQDVLLAPDDGNRYEAVAGELYVTPPPSYEHQRISARLHIELHRLLEEPGHGVVVYAPVGVEFPDTEEGVQPDLVFVSRARSHIIRRGWIRGAPDLVIEILSPTTAGRDRSVKLDLYRRQGVAEYWVVDPDARAVEVWRFPVGGSSPEIHTHEIPVGVGERIAGVLDLASIFPVRD